MNDQTTRDLSEVVRELNEQILNIVKFIATGRSWADDLLTISDLEEGLRNLSEDILRNPDNAILYINRGNVYFYILDYESAISDYSRALQINPENPEVYLNSGVAHFRKGEYDRAISDYNEAIRINPKYAEAYDARSETFNRKGESDKARADCEKALELGFDVQTYAEDSSFELIEDLVGMCPRNAKVYYYRGLVHHHQGSHNLAIEDYNESIRLDPRCAEAYHERAKTYSTIFDSDADYNEVIERYDQAIMDYDKAKQLGYDYRGTPRLGLIGIREPTIELIFERGEIYAQKGDYDKAIADMSEVIERDSNFNDLYDEVVLRTHEDIYLGDEFWASDPPSSHFGSDPSARAYNNRGFYHYKKGENDQAIADLTEALRVYNEQVKFDPESNPDFATIYLNLGSVYYAKKENEKALENYDSVVRLCPNYEIDFMDSKFIRGGEEAVEEAIELMNRVISNPPESDADFYYTGVLALFWNDRLSAKREFQIALLLGYEDQDKINQHLKNLEERK